jgi:hypothetical protein
VGSSLSEISRLYELAPLPALVDRLETVTVGIENVRSVIMGIVIKERRAPDFPLSVAPTAIAAS